MARSLIKAKILIRVISIVTTTGPLGDGIDILFLAQ